MSKLPKLAGHVPPWVKEKRQPTKAELAAKHHADGGGMAPQGPGNSLGDDESSAPVIKRFQS